MNRPRVVVAGQLPPPTHGMSLNTALVAERLRGVANVVAISTSGGVPADRIRWHARRIGSVLVGIPRALRSLGPRDALYAPVEHGLGRMYNIAFILCARARRAAIVLHHHSYSYVTETSRLMKWLVDLAGDATHVFLCDDMAERFVERYGSVSSSVVSNAGLIASRDAGRSPDDRLTIGLLSNLTANKGVDLFARLAAEVTTDLGSDRVRFRLAGPADPTAAEVIAGAASVEWVGPLYGQDKEDFLAGLDVFVFPTQYAVEAQPNVLFEAAAHGALPIAVARGCIGGDVERLGGLGVDPDEDFVSAASDRLAELAREPESVRRIRGEVAAAYDVLHREAQMRLGTLLALVVEGGRSG